MSNRITEENARTDGVQPKSYWDAASSNQIEGFTTDFSVNAGQTVSFKININPVDAGNHANTSDDYRIEIFRLGYYGGDGAREVAEITNTHGTVQPEAQLDPTLGLVDAGNWSVTDQWQIPEDAVSGVYLARVQRLDANGNPIEGATNQIPFIVRNDGLHADIVLQTSDTTWQAYNGWGGNNGELGPNFYGDPTGVVDSPTLPEPGLNTDRAYAVSYNRPFLTRDGVGTAAGAQDYLFGADYAAIYWLEKNGYDVSYMSGVDTARLGASYLENYEAFISVGHDEYWSGDQRANVEAARDAGVNLLFWSGNEVYWKTRWGDAMDGTDYRTLISYKETWANGDPNAGPADYANIDPSNEWTGTWRDMRFVGNPGATGQEPENSLTGQLFGPDGTGEFGGVLDVPGQDAVLRYWRDTSVSANGGAQDLTPGLLGYEWDTVPLDQYRPAGLITLSETTLNWSGILVDQGNRTEPGTATHSLSLYRAPSGALVFGAGTVFWSWALSNEHDSSPYGANIENRELQQFTVNVFADMGIQPGSLQAGLTPATASADHTAASVAINPVGQAAALSNVTITGTATDNDNNPATNDGVVALVELSFDGGAHWVPATGTTSWSYSWRPATAGDYTIQVRAIDDSLNVYNATVQQKAVTVTSAVAPDSFSLFDLQAPATAGTFNDGQPVETGMRFTVAQQGEITELRYYRASGDSGDTDVRQGQLWRVSDGALLGTATFTSGPGESGWQLAALSSPVAVEPGVEYIVSYLTNDNYTAQNGFFAPANEVPFDGVDDNAFTGSFGMVSAPEDTAGHANGLYRYGNASAMPTDSFGSSNYLVDVTFVPAGDPETNSPPVISSANYTLAENGQAVGNVTATDGDGDALTYAIAGGADASLFNINSTSGALSFKTAPDYENPSDSGANNVYDLTVSATDNLSDPVTKAITVTVTDVSEMTGSSLFGAGDAPSNFVSAASDSTNYELGVKFSPAEDGSITALRYYRGAVDADDTDARTLNLWSSSGTLLASVQVTSTPGDDGWQVGNLLSPVSLTAGQTYVVSYGYAFNNGDGNPESYAASQNYFTTAHSSLDGLLTAPASGQPSGPSSDGIGNGLFAVGAPGSFPTQSFNASNYWVDVIFEGSTPTTNQPPTITSGASFEALENQVIIGTVTARDPESNPLTFAIAGGADANLFTINPTSGLLLFKDPQDFETKNAFSVGVSVSDGTNPPVTQDITVSLSDVDETANGPASLTGHLLKANYIFGSTPTSVWDLGPGGEQTATVGDGVEFATLPNAGAAVGNGNDGLASVDAGAQTIRIEFPLDQASFSGSTFIRFAGPQDGRPYNGVLLTDGDFSLDAIQSVRIVGQEGFTTQNGQSISLTADNLTVTEDGIFLNVSNLGRLVDVDPNQPGAQSAWVELLVEINDPPVVTAASLTVSEGGTSVLSASDFAVTDADSASFTFNVSNVTHGTFQANVGGTWSDVTSFTAAQLTAGEVRFVHDGDQAAPTFDIAASDGSASSAPVEGTVNYGAIDNAPELTSAAFSISEGGTRILSSSDFTVSDADSSAFTFTVSGVSHGQFETMVGGSWTEATGFTSAQLAAGEVRFVHDGGEDAPTFDIAASDGTSTSAPLSGDVSFTNVNDAPVVTGAALAVSEGGSVVVTPAGFTVADPDSSAFTFTLSAVTHGTFQTNVAGTWSDASSFTSAQLAAGEVRFVHDGSETAPTFSIAASDGSLSSEAVAGTVDYGSVNSPPALTSAALTVSEGATAVLNASNFAVNDPDSSAFTYTVSNVTHGTFQTNVGGTWSNATSFTSAELAAGQVRFAHDGGEETPTFDASVSDGSASSSTISGDVSFTNVNDAPTLSSAGLTISEGGTAVLNATDFAVSDPDSSAFTYSVSNVAHGTFQTNVGGTWTDATSFTSAQLSAGQVRFVHDGGEAAPAFDVSANDGSASSGTISGSVDFSGAGDAPTLSGAGFTVSEGGTAVLNASNFAVSDPDSSAFTYSVSNVTHGTFQTNVGGTWTDATSFTSGQLSAGHVRFAHDGGEAAPTFDASASDGSASSSTISGSVGFTNVNDAPTLSSAGLTVSEGGTAVLNASDFAVSDPDSSAFTYSVSNVTHGVFQTNVGGTWSNATSFTSAQLAAGEVRFVHDGGEATPGFTVTASDGSATSAPLAATASFTNVNDAPALSTALQDQSATTGSAFSFQVPPETFHDDDGDALTYSATLTDGSALPSWLSFEAGTGTFSGTPTTGDIGSLSVRVTASDGTDSASDDFDIAVAQANSAPTAISLSANSVVENSPAAVIGTLTTSDPDTGETFTYGVSDSRFEVATDTSGVTSLKLRNGQSLDYETAKSVTLNVRSTDRAGLSVLQQFTIDVTNVIENQAVTMTSSSFTAPSPDNWTITGTSGADAIVTLDGNDTIRGQGGDDTISTGAGADAFLYSGTGNGSDAVNGGEGTDTVRATANNTVIGLRSLANVETISSGGLANVGIAGSASADTLDFTNVQLTGIVRIDAGAGNDNISGSSAADTIVGASGNDVLRGGGGNDLFQVAMSNGSDNFDGGSGTDTIAATARNVAIGIAGLTGIEQISGGGFAGVSIAGTAFADSLDFSAVTLSGITRIDAGAGNDTLLGSAASDTIAGGAGDDMLSGGGGNDTFQVDANAGFDTYDGGAGIDTIVATGKNVAIGISSLVGVESISGGGYSGVQIAGSSGSNTLDFTSVQLVGIASIDGGAGNDFILGSGAANRIGGGAGRDTLTGGGGADTFFYTKVSDSSMVLADSIQDFLRGQDRIDVSAIDANVATGKNDTFTFLGDETNNASFHSRAGQLWTVVENGVTHIYADVDGGGADFTVVLSSQQTLTASDFLL